MLKDGILYVERVLDPVTCAALRNLYDEFRDRGTQRDYNGNRVVYYTDMPRPRRIALAVVALLAHKRVADVYGINPWVESAFLNRLGTGNRLELHYDNVKPDGVTPNHTPQRCHSSLFYLSGDFDGGEVVFPQQSRSIKPTEGSFISFPAGAPYQHHVEKVTRGWRYTASVWFTNDPKKVLKEVCDGQ